MLLYGKPVIEKLLNETVWRSHEFAPHGGYVAFLLVSRDQSSAVYVSKKQQYAHRCGLWAQVYERPDASFEELIGKIEERNADTLCLGIVVQLPLADHLKYYKAKLLYAVDPLKDVDGLGGVLFGLHSTNMCNFLPATPKATYSLLDFYWFGYLSWQTVTVIGQSGLMGKPFALEAMHRGATVISCNSLTPRDFLVESCLQSDLIVTATGVVWLLSPKLFAGKDLSWKVFVDVGYGIVDGKAYGDTDWEWLATMEHI